MCTVLLRFAPAPGEGSAPDGPTSPWPLLVAAVRDEFLERAWDPPAAHWPDSPGLVGGRDRTAGGTWLAVRRPAPAFAALLNGVRLPLPPSGVRPSRGGLPLAALRGQDLGHLSQYDGFHLLLGTPTSLAVWSWDGVDVVHRELPPGDHIVVNLGVDTVDDPLVPHFAPLLAATPSPADDGSADAGWAGWLSLLRGDGLDPDDPRALLVRKHFEGRTYGSSSASLIGLAADRVRYDFTATPLTPQWTHVDLP